MSGIAGRQRYAVEHPCADPAQVLDEGLRAVDELPGGDLLCTLLAVDR